MFRRTKFFKFCSIFLLLAFVFGQASPFFSGQSLTYFIHEHLNEGLHPHFIAKMDVDRSIVGHEGHFDSTKESAHHEHSTNHSEDSNCHKHNFFTVNLSAVCSNEKVDSLLLSFVGDPLLKPNYFLASFEIKNVVFNLDGTLYREGHSLKRNSHVNNLLLSNHAIRV